MSLLETVMTYLETFTGSLADLEDSAVCPALADHLEEVGDVRAALVRELANAVPVIPQGTPQWMMPDDGEMVFIPVDMEPVTGMPCDRTIAVWPEHQPMACGTTWSISRIPTGVFADVYPESALLHALAPGQVMGRPIPLSCHTEAQLRLGFEITRRMLLGLAIGVLIVLDGDRLHCMIPGNLALPDDAVTPF